MTKRRKFLICQDADMNTVSDRLRELDGWHSELLDRLALLDKQVNDVLQEWTAVKEESPEPQPSAATAA